MNAAEGGQLHILKWIHANYSLRSDITTHAALSGDIPTLEWLKAKEFSFAEIACANAAKAGHLPALQWLRANGCPWNSRTCEFAISGHLHVLQWAVANGCPWSSNTLLTAKRYGRYKEFIWAKENGCPSNPSLDSYYDVIRQDITDD
jgi:hypothetical protein